MGCPKCKGELKFEEITVKSRFGKKLDPPEDFIVYWCENPSCRYGFRERKVTKKSLELHEKLTS